MPSYPSDLPYEVVMDSFKVLEITRPAKVTEFEDGPPLARPSGAGQRAKLQYRIILNNAVQMETFRAFFTDTLMDGTARFTMPVWVPGSGYNVRTVMFDQAQATIEPFGLQFAISFTLIVFKWGSGVITTPPDNPPPDENPPPDNPPPSTTVTITPTVTSDLLATASVNYTSSASKTATVLSGAPTGLTATLPTVTLTGNRGRVFYRGNLLTDGTVVDATGATWIEDNDATTDGTPSNAWPFRINNSSNVEAFGGTIQGTIDQTTDWATVYARGNSAGLNADQTPGIYLHDWRITNTWDAINLSWNCNDFLVERIWATNVRDDAVQNDKLCAGIVRNCLFENCFAGLSVDPSKAQPVDGHTNTVWFDNVLLHFSLWSYEGIQTHASFVKTDSSTPNTVTPSLRWTNCVVAIINPNHQSYRSVTDAWAKMTPDSTGNVYLNLSDTPLPDTYPAPIGGWGSTSGWSLLQGQAARDYWKLARARWLAAYLATPRASRLATQLWTNVTLPQILAAKAQGKVAVVSTVIPRSDLNAVQETARLAYNQIVREQALIKGYVVTDYTALTPFDEKADTANTTYYVDGVTVTSTGSQTMAGLLNPTLQTALKSAPPTLVNLTLSTAPSVVAGQNFSATILGRAQGSTITVTSSDGTVLTVTGSTVNGVFASTGTPTLTFTETYVGVLPHTTTISTTVVAPVLSNLVLSPSSTPALGNYSGTIQGRTLGSTLTATASDGTPLTLIGNTLFATFPVQRPITITLVETLGIATNTPHTSALSFTVTGPVLADLTLSTTTPTAGLAYSATIIGKTAGSTITATASDGTVLTVSGTTVSGTFATAGSRTITLTETLTGAVNTPHASPVAVAVLTGDLHWADVVLLAGFDRPDRATSYTEESSKAIAATFVEGAEVTANSPPGGSGALLCTGTLGAVTFPYHDDYRLVPVAGTKFTLEVTVVWNALPTVDGYLVAQYATDVANRSWSLVAQNTSNRVAFQWSVDGIVATSPLALMTLDSIQLGRPYRLCVDSDGTTLRGYVDGVMTGQKTGFGSVAFFNAQVPLALGSRSAPLASFHSGLIDELRITKGFARCASDAGYTITGPVFARGPDLNAVTLTSLALSATTATAGTAYSATVNGKSTGSTITATSSDGTSLTVSGTTVSGTFLSSGSKTITLTETLAGATNSPRVSTATVTVAAATSFQSETTALLARMTVQPNSTRQNAIDTLINSLKFAGVWSKLDCFYVLAAHDAQAGLLNWKGTTFTLDASTGPTFTTDRGYTGDGVASALQSGFNPATATTPAFTLASCHMGVWQISQAPNSSVMGSSTSRIGITTAPGLVARSNEAASATTTTVASSVRHAMWSRTATATYKRFASGAVVATTTADASAFTSASFSLLRIGSTFCATQIGAAHWGSGLSDSEATALYNALNTYMTAVGAA